MSMSVKMTGKLHSMYDPHRLEVSMDNFGPSKARQEFLDECDVNGIMERYEKTNVWPFPDVDMSPRYFDATNVPDLQTALAVMIDAEAAFMSLPAKVRKEFDNSAIEFVAFAQDEKNLDKMREWGLAPPAKAPDGPMKVEVVNPAPDAAKASGDGSKAS